MKPIRILHVIGIMNRGGTETMIMNLYRKIDRNQVQFDFVEHTTEKAAYDDEILRLGGHVFHCPKSDPQNLFSYIRWWKRFFKTEGREYQIIHGHIGSTASIYLSIAKNSGLYTIAHSHSAGYEMDLHSWLYRIVSYPTRYIADYFFACSAAAGESRFGEKICHIPDKYSVLPNAIDVNKFQFDAATRRRVRELLQVTPEMKVLGHVGRFTKEKNHSFLLHIFSAYHKIQKNSCLLLVGDGPMRAEIERLAEQMHIRENVKFLGICSNVNELMQAMDMFLFPSLYEGLGVVLIEAQASGLPCLITDTIPEEAVIVQDIMKKKSLNEPATIWAEELLNIAEIERKSCTESVKRSGFDVTETAKWLEAFYCDKATR